MNIRRKALSLRARLIRSLLLPLLAICIIGGFFSYYVALRYANTAYDRALFNTNLTLASQIRLVDGQIADIPVMVRNMLTIDEKDQVFLRITDLSTGKLVFGSNRLPLPQQDTPMDGRAYFTDTVIDKQPVRVALLHTALTSNGEHSVLVEVAETLNKRRILARDILAGIILPQMLLSVLLIAAATAGISHGLSALVRLQEEVNRLSHRNLAPLPTDEVPGEVRGLVDAINQLIRRIATILGQQQRFISNATHQLRTPLTALKLEAEIALRQTEPDSMRQGLTQIVRSAERNTRLIKQLLTLLRVEPGAAELPTEQVDLSALASSTTEEWVPQAARAGIDLGLDAEGGSAVITGNRVLLGELLNNLIDNALRYSASGSSVTVYARVGENISLGVRDSGPGIPLNERERIFERFHRVLGTAADGCGLGLSIVKEIADHHSGHIVLDSGAWGTDISVVFEL